MQCTPNVMTVYVRVPFCVLECIDIKGLEKPDALQLRMKSRRCLHVCDSKLLHLDWNVDRRRLAICTEVRETVRVDTIRHWMT